MTYNIAKEYDRKAFSRAVDLLEKIITNVESSEYSEDMLDGNQTQLIKHKWVKLK